jgi:hypothetical protein
MCQCTKNYIGENVVVRSRCREYLGGVISFSQSWYVLSPSFPVCSASVSSFPGSPFLSTNVWESISKPFTMYVCGNDDGLRTDGVRDKIANQGSWIDIRSLLLRND